MCTERVGIVLDNQKTLKDVSEPDRHKWQMEEIGRGAWNIWGDAYFMLVVKAGPGDSFVREQWSLNFRCNFKYLLCWLCR